MRQRLGVFVLLTILALWGTLLQGEDLAKVEPGVWKHLLNVSFACTLLSASVVGVWWAICDKQPSWWFYLIYLLAVGLFIMLMLTKSETPPFTDWEKLMVIALMAMHFFILGDACVTLARLTVYWPVPE